MNSRQFVRPQDRRLAPSGQHPVQDLDDLPDRSSGPRVGDGRAGEHVDEVQDPRQKTSDLARIGALIVLQPWSPTGPQHPRIPVPTALKLAPPAKPTTFDAKARLDAFAHEPLGPGTRPPRRTPGVLTHPVMRKRGWLSQRSEPHP